MKLKDYDKGWWDCFETFAERILFFMPTTGENVCKNTLADAGITKEQIETWLEKQKEKSTAKDVVINTVKQYLITHEW